VQSRSIAVRVANILLVLRTAARQRVSNQISDLVDREAENDDCDSLKKTKIYILQYRRCRNRKYEPRDNNCSQPEIELVWMSLEEAKSQNKTCKCAHRQEANNGVHDIFPTTWSAPNFCTGERRIVTESIIEKY
jgi:hypothetical protein